MSSPVELKSLIKKEEDDYRRRRPAILFFLCCCFLVVIVTGIAVGVEQHGETENESGPGACCLQNESCQDTLTNITCIDVSGTFQGEDSTCNIVQCLVVTTSQLLTPSPTLTPQPTQLLTSSPTLTPQPTQLSTSSPTPTPDIATCDCDEIVFDALVFDATCIGINFRTAFLLKYTDHRAIGCTATSVFVNTTLRCQDFPEACSFAPGEIESVDVINEGGFACLLIASPILPNNPIFSCLGSIPTSTGGSTTEGIATVRLLLGADAQQNGHLTVSTDALMQNSDFGECSRVNAILDHNPITPCPQI